MECVICGESTLDKITQEHIANIKAKRPKMEKEIVRIFDSDPELAKKLRDKLKKYDEEIEQLETGSHAAKVKLCDNCWAKMEDVITSYFSKYKEEVRKGEKNLKEFKKYLKEGDAEEFKKNFEGDAEEIKIYLEKGDAAEYFLKNFEERDVIEFFPIYGFRSVIGEIIFKIRQETNKNI
jgi:hypothetical protein